MEQELFKLGTSLAVVMEDDGAVASTKATLLANLEHKIEQ